MTGTPDIDALVEYLVTSLVEHPDEVSIVKHEDASSTAYEITVHPDPPAIFDQEQVQLSPGMCSPKKYFIRDSCLDHFFNHETFPGYTATRMQD